MKKTNLKIKPKTKLKNSIEPAAVKSAAVNVESIIVHEVKGCQQLRVGLSNGDFLDDVGSISCKKTGYGGVLVTIESFVERLYNTGLTKCAQPATITAK